MGLFGRLLHAGRMPEAIRTEVAGERVLFEAEGVRVALHRSGRVPGVVTAGGVNVGFGSFAVTDRRVIGSRGRAKWVDVPYDGSEDGPATFVLDVKGLHVLFDLDKVHPATHGTMRIDFHQDLTDELLASFPVERLSFPVDPQKVVRLFGSRKKLPTS